MMRIMYGCGIFHLLLLAAVSLAQGNSGKKPSKPECPVICPGNYYPYCGTDEITYSNQCGLKIAMCKNESLSQKHKGPCIKHVKCDKGCTREYSPHCGSDGKTYGNKCMFEIAACKNPNLKLLYERECNTHEGFCPQKRQGNCTESCTNDKDCNKGEKCCKAECGQSCLKACRPEITICKPCPKGQRAKLKLNKDGCMACNCVKYCRPRLCRPCYYGYLKDLSGCPTCSCEIPPYCKYNKYRICFGRYLRARYGCPRCRSRLPCPKVRCPPGCRPGKRRFVQSLTGCYRCYC